MDLQNYAKVANPTLDTDFKFKNRQKKYKHQIMWSKSCFMQKNREMELNNYKFCFVLKIQTDMK